MWRHREKAAVNKPGRERSLAINPPYEALIWDVQLPELHWLLQVNLLLIICVQALVWHMLSFLLGKQLGVEWQAQAGRETNVGHCRR